MGIGELVWDMLPGGRQLGGAPVNFAYWCGRLGAEGYPVSAVGGDDLGREAFDRLAGTGLDLGYVQRNALPTGRVNVTLSGNGIPGYDIVEGVAWDALEADARTLELAAQADAVCWGSLAQRSEASRMWKGPYYTGTTAASIKKGKIKRTGLDKSITVAPQGHNKRGTRNAEVAFVNEFGKRGQPGRPALKTANERKEQEAVAAGEKVYHAYLDGKKL